LDSHKKPIVEKSSLVGQSSSRQEPLSDRRWPIVLVVPWKAFFDLFCRLAAADAGVFFLYQLVVNAKLKKTYRIPFFTSGRSILLLGFKDYTRKNA
jgi:hypothetical protein